MGYSRCSVRRDKLEKSFFMAQKMARPLAMHDHAHDILPEFIQGHSETGRVPFSDCRA
jgi:hypothetical protein